jgi:WW domain-containing oxidoreductase
MSFIEYFIPKGKNGFGFGTTTDHVLSGISLKDKNILITGCNSGLGKESVRALSAAGARIIGTARTKDKAIAAMSEVGAKNSLGLACELSDPRSVQACVEEIKRNGKKLDAIICNAGIMAIPKTQKSFGYELQFFTNHIGHFILVTGLLDNLSNDGRVVMLSSSAHTMAPLGGIEFDNLGGDKNYKAWTAYGQSKFANLLFAKELSRRFAGTNNVATAVHPGVIFTNLARHMNLAAQFAFRLTGPLFFKSIPQGAATQCFAAVHPEAESLSGAYLANCNVAKYRKDADDEELAKKLWQVSEKIIRDLR